METYIKRSQKDCTLAFKLSVVEQVERGELNYKQAQQRYGIQGSHTVMAWLRQYNNKDAR
jgi:transposase-like protein